MKVLVELREQHMPLAALPTPPVPPFPFVTNQCILWNLLHHWRQNSFSFKWQRSPPSPSQQPTQALASATTELDREAGRASYANIAWVGGSPEQTVQQCEGSCKPRPQKPVAKQPPAKGREGEEGPWIQQLLPDLSSHCVNASQPANQSAREGKCVSVRVWGPEFVFLCVSVSVCATKRDREREREAVAVSGGGETRQPVQQRFKVNGTSCAAPLPLCWIIPLGGTHPLD